MAIYMQLEGIEGGVTAEGHEKWIEMDSFRWGVGRGIAMGVGSSGEREASTPTVSEVALTKQMDKTSPRLFQEACAGKGKKVTLHLIRTGSDLLQTYMTYILEDCMVSGYSVNSDGDRPSESLSLSFAKMTMSYTPYDNAGQPLSPVKSGFDLATGKRI